MKTHPTTIYCNDFAYLSKKATKHSKKQTIIDNIDFVITGFVYSTLAYLFLTFWL